jgi:hypothetical protein
MAYYECQTQVLYLKYKQRLPKNANLFTSGLMRRLIWRVFLGFVQPITFLKCKDPLIHVEFNF